ncbi:SP-RING-type domain-containing protein [Pseudoscourfieldia marina]
MDNHGGGGMNGNNHNHSNGGDYNPWATPYASVHDATGNSQYAPPHHPFAASHRSMSMPAQHTHYSQHHNGSLHAMTQPHDITAAYNASDLEGLALVPLSGNAANANRQTTTTTTTTPAYPPQHQQTNHNQYYAHGADDQSRYPNLTRAWSGRAEPYHQQQHSHQPTYPPQYPPPPTRPPTWYDPPQPPPQLPQQSTDHNQTLNRPVTQPAPQSVAQSSQRQQSIGDSWQRISMHAQPLSPQRARPPQTSASTATAFAPGSDAAYIQQCIHSLRVVDLSSICEKLGRPKSGNKAELQNRIVAYLRSPSVTKERLAEVRRIVSQIGRNPPYNSHSEQIQSNGHTVTHVDVCPVCRLEPNKLRGESMLTCRICGTRECTKCAGDPTPDSKRALADPAKFACGPCRVSEDPWLPLITPAASCREASLLGVKTLALPPFTSGELAPSGARYCKARVEFKISEALWSRLISPDAARTPSAPKRVLCVRISSALRNDKVPRCYWPRHVIIKVNGQQWTSARLMPRNANAPLGAKSNDEPIVLVGNTGPGIVSDSAETFSSSSETNVVPAKHVLKQGINIVEMFGAFDRGNVPEHAYGAAPGGNAFQLVVQLVNAATFDDIIKGCRADETKDEAVARAKRSFVGGDEDDDDDLMVLSSKLPLKCPLTGKYAGVPARTVKCRHLAVFDRDTFLLMERRARKWKCPICTNAVKLCEVFVDGYASHVLEELKRLGEEDAEVEVDPNGFWRYGGEKNKWRPVVYSGTAVDGRDQRNDKADAEQNNVESTVAQPSAPPQPSAQPTEPKMEHTANHVSIPEALSPSYSPSYSDGGPPPGVEVIDLIDSD